MTATETVLPFPMPGMQLHGRTVIASVEYFADERGVVALVLLLNQEAPYFTVAHYYQTSMAEETVKYGDLTETIEARPAGFLHILGTHENIVPAVREYEDSGGDY
jgi:hypothetical protein